MPLTYPPPGINMFCRAGTPFKSITSTIRGVHTTKAIAKNQIRTENKYKRTPFTSCGIAGIGDLTVQGFITNHNINYRIKLFLN
jgi:hypothetical protein